MIATLLVLSFATAILSSSDFVAKNNRDLIIQTHSEMEYIQQVIDHFFEENGFFPCPAGHTLAVGDANYGVSEVCDAPGVAATSRFNSSAGGSPKIRKGSIPTRSLNIADQYMLDGWGNRYSYFVIEDLAQDSAAFDAFNSIDTLKFIALDDPTTTSTPELHADVIASSGTAVGYVIISHGAKVVGAYTNTGTQVSCAGSLTREIENCDLDSNLHYTGVLNTSNTAQADFFDDIVVWKMVK